MGKIVKFCDGCNESFAKKFEYCPNCGQKMQAFEMNPVAATPAVEERPKAAEPQADTIPLANDQADTIPTVTENQISEAADTLPSAGRTVVSGQTETDNGSEPVEEPILELDDIDEMPPANAAAVSETVEVAPETYIPGKENPISETAETYTPYPAEESFQEVRSVPAEDLDDDDDFHVHFLKEKNVKQRNLLLLASMLFMVSLSVGVVVHSLFTHVLDVGAINEDLVAFVPVIDEVPMNLEEEIEMKKDDEGGGGGGGGRDEDTPTSKGQLAPQTREPIFKSPSKTDVKKDFELKQQSYTEGDIQNEQTDEPYGDPTSKYDKLSDGRGSGGGQGSGTGTGQGSGEGTGRGSGKGSGSGSGIGRGNGDGTGDGSGGEPAPTPRPRPVGPTRSIELISKPQPRYTEEARKNNYQGSVTLRVTFLANGRIGSVAPVNRLPYGLTEQAIAAAKRIQFRPALRNGQPVQVSKRIQYSFTIY